MKKLLIVVAVLVLIQLIPITKNQGSDQTYSIEKGYLVPDNISQILKDACNDCHSNNTIYPWYASIQPVAFWLNHHVEEGKEHLDFSNFMKLPPKVQRHKLDEVVETVEEGEMPLSSYTYFGLHPKANLTQEQREVLITWAKVLKSKIKE